MCGDFCLVLLSVGHFSPETIIQTHYKERANHDEMQDFNHSKDPTSRSRNAFNDIQTIGNKSGTFDVVFLISILPLRRVGNTARGYVNFLVFRYLFLPVPILVAFASFVFCYSKILHKIATFLF